MKTGINEHEFQQMCEGVERDSAAILRERGELLARSRYSASCSRASAIDLK